MKVSAINSFSPSVNFEKRERKTSEVSRGHQTNPMKAVPLVVLIAMSPLNSVNTNAQSKDATTTPFAQLQNAKLLRADVYDSEDYIMPPDCSTFAVQLWSTDGNDSDCEKATLMFYNDKLTDGSRTIERLDLMPTSLDIIDSKYYSINKNTGDTVYSPYSDRDYYVSGDLAYVDKSYKRWNNTGEIIVNNPSKGPEIKVNGTNKHINKEYYDMLKGLYGNTVKYNHKINKLPLRVLEMTNPFYYVEAKAEVGQVSPNNYERYYPNQLILNSFAEYNDSFIAPGKYILEFGNSKGNTDGADFMKITRTYDENSVQYKETVYVNKMIEKRFLVDPYSETEKDSHYYFSGFGTIYNQKTGETTSYDGMRIPVTEGMYQNISKLNVPGVTKKVEKLTSLGYDLLQKDSW